MRETIFTIAGMVGSFIASLFGGWDSTLVTLIIFMGVNLVTGYFATTMDKSKHTENSSSGGWVELKKKFCILLLIVVAVRLDIMLGTTYIRDDVCITFCINELLSIMENTRWMGPPYPPVMKNAIDILQKKTGQVEEITIDDENGNSDT